MTLDKFCYKVEIVITTINFFQFFRLWKYCKVLKLTQIYNCKICGTNLSGEIEKKNSDWILAFDEGGRWL